MTTELQKSAQKQLKHLFSAKKDIIKASIPPNVNIDQLVQSVLFAVQENPQLAECSVASLFISSIKSFQLGIDPNSARNLAYLIPYDVKGNMEAQLMISYLGMIDLAARSGTVKKIWAKVIHANDEYEIIEGTKPNIKHIPNYADRGEAILYYACVLYKDDTVDFEVMNMEDIAKIRAVSPAGKSDNPKLPWNAWFDEMAKKSVLKRLLKRVKMSVEDQSLYKAINYDNQISTGKPQDLNVIDVENLVIDAEHYQDNQTGESKIKNMDH